MGEITKKYLYEERITAWNADSIYAAIELAEKELNEEYALNGNEALDLFQAFWLFDEINLIPNGTEVFSLLRESDLEPDSYINSFFDTGSERLGEYNPPPRTDIQGKEGDGTPDPVSS